MRQRHSAFYVVHHDGLCVRSVVAARGAVTHVPHGDVSFAESCKIFGREHVVHQPDVFIRRKNAVVVDDDAAGFLPAMLKREQAVIGGARHVAGGGGINAEYAAFFS